MKINLLAVVALLLVAMSALADERIQIVETRPPTLPVDAPKAPLVAENDNSWLGVVPIWSGQSKDIRAGFWMATTTKAMLFHIVVSGRKQNNPYHERNLWRGDCIYLSLNCATMPLPMN